MKSNNDLSREAGQNVRMSFDSLQNAKETAQNEQMRGVSPNVSIVHLIQQENEQTNDSKDCIT